MGDCDSGTFQPSVLLKYANLREMGKLQRPHSISLIGIYFRPLNNSPCSRGHFFRRLLDQEKQDFSENTSRPDKAPDLLTPIFITMASPAQA